MYKSPLRGISARDPSPYKSRQMLHQSFLLVATVLAYVQVISPFTARTFDSPTSSLTFESTGDYFYSTRNSPDYSVFTWVQFRQLPTATPDSFISILYGATCAVDITKQLSGDYKAAVTYLNITPKETMEITVSGGTDGQWEHIALRVTSTSASLQVTKWKQASTSSTITLQTNEWNYPWLPRSSSLILGKVITGNVSNT